MDGGPVFTIDRYLGRAVNMTSISDRRERINNGQTDNLYCSDIQLAVELRASYLRRVTGVFTKADGMAIGAAYHTAAQQAITDILWAFDCAGLERPIIEGAFYEYVDNSVNNVPIPQYVLNEFQNDPDFATAGYSTSGSYNFDIAKMLYTAPAPLHTDPNHTPDVSKVTSRMWFFYQATQYINMGTLATHAGWLYLYTRNDPGYYYIDDVFQRIRNYGTLFHPQHFHVINADFCTDYPDCNDIYVGNPSNKQLLLDFNSSSVPSDEANHPQNMADSKCFNNTGFTSTGDNLYTELAYHKFQKQLYKGGDGGTAPM
ncbi:MAG: hypothetical protein K8F30_04275, partial [Taibaiella sp.]|nr:hypothetical protein [Taibaiella sp.]